MNRIVGLIVITLGMALQDSFAGPILPCQRGNPNYPACCNVTGKPCAPPPGYATYPALAKMLANFNL
jgi:hypothetical protein